MVAPVPPEWHMKYLENMAKQRACALDINHIVLDLSANMTGLPMTNGAPLSTGRAPRITFLDPRVRSQAD